MVRYPTSGDRAVAVDLGTAQIRIYRKGDGVVVDEPSVVALDHHTSTLCGIGLNAKSMLGRTPAAITACRPLDCGIIIDFEAARLLLRYYLAQVRRSRYAMRPIVVTAMPVGRTGIQTRAVAEAFRQAGAGGVHVVDAPLAAAVGAGMSVQGPGGSMVVDIGAGTTDAAVLALGTIVTAQSLPVAGNAFDQTLIEHVRQHHALQLSSVAAEQLKIAAGSPEARADGKHRIEVRGRDCASGLPRTLQLPADEIHEALEPPMRTVAQSIHEVLGQAPTDLAVDVMERGIVLTGGSAQLPGLDEELGRRLGVPIITAEEPQFATARGLGAWIEGAKASRRPLPQLA
ncbi:rod shape-determining protein MreB [Streptacidiphilus sp. MAP12-16]|uniref:rod shape-determining protein n=1 Tax=Streptacidiphilus sp. MAP12-16 TaxID=3156300 RepID=UPI00351309D5